MKSDDQEITHKELLTFNNLTNLEWEFAEIKIDSDDYEERDEDQSQYKPLIDLLTPEAFARRETDPDTGDEREIPVYGEGEEGLIEMRKEAGIAMEYAEKLDEGQEGEFLKDWEVIYAGDKYKILADYLDEREEILHDLVEEYTDEGELEGSLYPSREEIEEELEARLRIQYGAKLKTSIEL